MILKLLKKDIAVLMSDRKSLIVFILMPIILTTILSFSLKGSFQESGKFEPVKVGLVIQYDTEKETAQFLDKVSQYFNPEVFIEEMDFETLFFNDFLNHQAVKAIMKSEIMTEEEAERAMLSDEIVAVFYLPKGFIYNQLINFSMPYRNEIEIKMLSNPDYGYSAQIAESVMKGYFETLSSKVIQKNAFIEIATPYLDQKEIYARLQDIMAVEDQNGESSQVETMPKIELESINGEKPIDSFTYYSIAMMSMFILYASGYVGRELLREKKMLTLNRSAVAGITRLKVLMSKYLMTLILCAIQMSFLLIFAKLVLRVQWDRPLVMMLGIFFSAIAVSGVGIFVSAITLTQDSFKVANIFENVLIHIFALLGGSYIPLEVLPKAVGRLKIFAPNGVVLDLFLGIFKGVALKALVPQFLMLTIISILFSTISIWIVKKKEAGDYA